MKYFLVVLAALPVVFYTPMTDTSAAQSPLRVFIRAGEKTHGPVGNDERRFAAGAIVVAPPTTKPWGQTVAYVRDLEGMLVEICTPVES